MKLSEFCLTDLHIPPEWDKEFNHVATDSRDVEAGDLFIARAGLSSHGDEFIDAAVKAGAVVVLSEGKSGFRCIWHTDEASGAVASIPVFSTPDLGEQLSIWLHRRYASVKTLDLIGITGTNGKSSCAQYVAQLSSSLGEPCGVLGTLGNGVWPDLKPTRNTTADLATVLKSLEIMQQAGAKRAVMEVSSHGLEQGRVAGLSFRAVMMTNLTQDHLDYHGDMETYFAAKRRLFAEYDSPLALLNADDAWCRRLLDDAGLTAQH
ncbi:MAG: Mur ligase family protein, partial [Oceanobacter sp.]